ncbi:hypothetical protein BC828DRAFT_408379 [Blastocladiella britannica]|nr:hypothetical protein BC828DRAFT_408379 [Blastocladiella britannica]
MADLPPAPRRANRLLASYYGVSTATVATPVSASRAGSAADLLGASPRTPSHNRATESTDIDGEHFDADKYLKITLNEKTLSGLLKRDNELILEMKEIDGDRKTLVYENYSKLIDASDTIRKLREQVESVESEMAKLSMQVQDITSMAANLHGTFTHRKAHVHTLKRSLALSRRLLLLSSLPRQLAAAHRDGVYLRTVQFYASSKPTLEKCRHLPLFERLATESVAIIAQIRAAVLARLGPAGKLHKDAESLMADVQTLIVIAQDAPSVIVDYFFTGALALTGLLIRQEEQWLVSLDQMATQAQSLFTKKSGNQVIVKAAGAPAEASIPLFVLQLTDDEHESFVARMAELCGQAISRWETHLLPITAHALDAQLAAHQALVAQLASTPTIATAVRSAASAALVRRLGDAASRMVDDAAATLIEHTRSADADLDIAIAACKQALSELSTKVGEIVHSVSAMSAEIEVVERSPATPQSAKALGPAATPSPSGTVTVGTEMASDAARAIHDDVQAAFRDVVPQFLLRMLSPTNGTHAAPASAANVVESSSVLTRVALAMVVADGQLRQAILAYPLAPADRSGDDWAAQIHDVVRDAAVSALTLWVGDVSRRLELAVCEHVLGTNWVAAPHPKSVSRPWMVLCHDLDAVAVAATRSFPDGMWKVGGGAAASDAVSLDSTDNSSRASRRGGGHRSTYSASSLASIMATSTNGPSGGSPWNNGSAGSVNSGHGGDGRIAASGSVPSLSTAATGATGRGDPGSPPFHSHSGSGGRGYSPSSSLTPAERVALAGVTRLFSERIVYYPSAAAFADAPDLRLMIVSTLARIVSKAWIEHVRALTFSKNGFQQLLVDVDYVKARARNFAGGIAKRDRVITDLLDEVVTSAYRRCVDPVFLSRDAVAAILGASDSVDEENE